MGKQFKLTADQIRPIAEGYGACIATDLITVDGHCVHFMYREDPINDVDGGWRFMAGLESDEYVNDASNLAFYDVNTIANYDHAIIPYLDAPIGSAFERDSQSSEFVPVEFDVSED